MSNDEVERAIEFLLQSQATLTAKVDANTEAIAALTSTVDTLTSTVDALAGKVSGLAGVANTALEVANQTAENVALLITAQGQTNTQIARLATMYEQHVRTGH